MHSTTSDAYQAGMMAGYATAGIFALTVLLLIGGFFIFALVKACTRKTAGWIITASVTGFAGLAAGVVGLAGVGVLLGSLAAGQEDATLRMLSSSDGRYSVRVPGSWKSIDTDKEGVVIKGGNETRAHYVLVLVEDKKDLNLTLEEYGRATSEDIASKSSNGKAGPAEQFATRYSGYPAIRRRITRTLDGVDIIYQHTCVETPSAISQVLCWSLADGESRAKPVFDEVVNSFTEKGVPQEVEQTPR